MISHCLLLLLALCISCLGFVTADANTSSKKSNYQHYAISGVHSGVNPASGARPARVNILDMDAVTFALYIQALIEMQNAPESDETSWYQVAGIHGRPYAAWDHVPQAQGAPSTGYCTHSSVLFPTWHRPYLALFEQILSSKCQTIAAQYPASIREEYITAASNFRIPYWDWAASPAIPNIVDSPTVTIITSSGVLQTVANPLYSWKFPTLDPKYFPTQSSVAYDWYLADDSQTVRDPDTRTSPSDFIAADYNLEGANLQQATYYALTKSSTYNVFATQALPGPSIEAVHGQVHVDIGGQWGHMSELSYAAFDPIFWLHHCNVDRITALYQAMFPSSQDPNRFLTPYPEIAGTFALAITSYTELNDTLNTPLEPFSTNSQGTFWTSQTAQHLSTFGYTYPEIQDWNQTPSELAANVTAQVNALYGGQTATPSPSKRSVTADGCEQVIEWSASISISRYEMNGQRFSVRLFVGDVPADPTTWSTSCVGSFAVLPPPQAFSGSAANVTTYDEVSLMKALSRIGNDGQDVQTVVEYLTASFEWRVQLMNGTVVSEDQYQTLEIVVQEEVVTLARNIYEVPSYGDKTLHPEITRGKAGGYSG